MFQIQSLYYSIPSSYVIKKHETGKNGAKKRLNWTPDRK